MLLSPVCSHINQKTQFENPVMEAKRKLSVDTPIAAQPQAAAPSGKCTKNQALWNSSCVILSGSQVRKILQWVEVSSVTFNVYFTTPIPKKAGMLCKMEKG